MARKDNRRLHASPPELGQLCRVVDPPQTAPDALSKKIRVKAQRKAFSFNARELPFAVFALLREAIRTCGPGSLSRIALSFRGFHDDHPVVIAPLGWRTRPRPASIGTDLAQRGPLTGHRVEILGTIGSLRARL